jgi:hypothetical protein
LNKKQALEMKNFSLFITHIKFLREQPEFLCELVESQNLHLQYRQQQPEEVEQELKATNQNLCIALLSQGSHP